MARHRDKWGKKGRKEKEGRKKGRGGEGKVYWGHRPSLITCSGPPTCTCPEEECEHLPPAFLDARRAEGLALNPGPIVSPLSLFPEFPNRDTNVFAAYLRGFMGQKSVLPQSMSPWNL